MTSDMEAVSSSISKAFNSGSVDQVAFLVEDLKESIQMWSAALGLTDWKIYTYSQDNIQDPTYRGEVGKFKMRLALAGTSPQIELIQPLEGPSIYHDWIAKHGYGMHHLGFFVSSVENTIEDLQKDGIGIIQSGRGYGLDTDGGFAYIETPGTFDVVLEAIEVPKRRRPSEVL